MIQLEFPSKSEFLPEFNILLYNNSIDSITTKELTNVVLKEEPNIIAIKSKVPEDDPTWITGKLWGYNFLDFDYPCVRQFKHFIFDTYIEYMTTMNADTSKPVYIQCWANIIRNNNRIITPHHHADAHGGAPAIYSYISGNISLQTENTSTVFGHPIFNRKMSIGVPNVNGELILFPSFLTHWTSVNLSDNPRITVSFDIITDEVYNMLENNSNYRLLNK